MTPRLVAAAIALIARLVPVAEREEWRREWLAEFAHAAKHDRRAPWPRLGAAVRHALWLRGQRSPLHTIASDVRHAWRALRHRPGFAIAVIVTLGLGIGANTAIESAARAVFWQPLPYPDSDRLVTLSTARVDRTDDGDDGRASAADFVDWRRDAGVFTDLAAVKLAGGTLTGAGDAEQLSDAAVTSSFFRVLGIGPLYGRVFQPEDDVDGGPGEAILGFDLWQRRFGGDPAIVGTSIMLAGTSRLVVGVMPRGFVYPIGFDLWVPLRFSARDVETARGAHYVSVIGRLGSGVSLAAAQGRMTAIAADLADRYPTTNRALTAKVRPLRDALVGNVRPAMHVLVAAVALVFLVGGVNVASLTLGAALGRRRDLAVRAALGASRSRLVRALFVESAMLAAAGGLVGLAIASGVIHAMASFHQIDIPLLDHVRVDGWTLAYAGVITAAAAVLFGVLPAVRLSGGDVTAALRSAGTRTTGDRGARTLRGALVAAELALAVALLVGAGLLARSFLALVTVDLGLDASRVHTFEVSLSTTAYNNTARQVAFVDDLLGRLRARPDVEAAGAVFGLPLGDFDYHYTLHDRDGQPLPQDLARNLAVQLRIITPGYFQAMSIRVMAGRGVTDDDRRGTPPVVVINAAAARVLWPGQSPLGHRVTLSSLGGDDRAGGEVVGVVADVHEFGPSQASPPIVYVTFRQHPIDVYMVAVKARGPAPDLDRGAKAIVAALDPDVPYAHSRAMAEVAADAVARPRLYLEVLALFAVAAIGLAAVGTYGVVAQNVGARTREIGIRVALGATRSQVVALIVGQAGRLALLGIGVGLAIAAISGRAMAGLLFGVRPADALTYGAVAGAALLITLLAAWLPARRATRVDPSTALRGE